eukprot:2020743-Rhodomonas_salina.2
MALNPGGICSARSSSRGGRTPHHRAHVDLWWIGECQEWNFRKLETSVWCRFQIVIHIGIFNFWSFITCTGISMKSQCPSYCITGLGSSNTKTAQVPGMFFVRSAQFEFLFETEAQRRAKLVKKAENELGTVSNPSAGKPGMD